MGTTMPNIMGSTIPGGYGGNNFYGYGSIGNTNANPFAQGLGGSNLSAGNPNLTGAYTGTFGQGFGQAYSNLLSTGGYNPAVYNALINQMQPQIQSGIATLGASAGAAGNRFGSGYELGLGDYLSQVNANQSAMAAQLYQQAVQNQMNMLQQSMPYNYENAQSPGFWGGLGEGLLSSALGGLVGAATGGLGGLISGAFKGGGSTGGFQGGVFDPGGSFGSSLPPTNISGVMGTVPGSSMSADLSSLSNIMQTPGISSTQSYADILGMNFAGTTGSNILGGNYNQLGVQYNP